MVLAAIWLSQNAEIAAVPRCPLPDGSIGERPTGSSMMPSGAKRAIQSSLRLALTAAIDLLETARAGCSSDSDMAQCSYLVPTKAFLVRVRLGVSVRDSVS